MDNKIYCSYSRGSSHNGNSSYPDTNIFQMSETPIKDVDNPGPRGIKISPK